MAPESPAAGSVLYAGVAGAVVALPTTLVVLVGLPLSVLSPVPGRLVVAAVGVVVFVLDVVLIAVGVRHLRRVFSAEHQHGWTVRKGVVAGAVFGATVASAIALAVVAIGAIIAATRRQG